MPTASLLYKELRQQSTPLADNLDAITKAALELWQSQHLRTYTAHGEDHILQVVNNLDALTRGLQASPEKLQVNEIFVLLAACYLHDIGMQLGERDAREQHAQYAFDLILHSHARHLGEERRITLPIDDRNARQSIASVARGHWTNFAVQLESQDTIVGNIQGRLRLLGLLLAIADLLDLSPVRATYYRTIHRLDKLDAVAELHQTKHELVKGFQIVAPNVGIAEELQYQLDWSDDSETTRTVSDWELHWFHSQWRTIAPLLYNESSGRVRWARPWALVKFRSPVGPIPNLSEQAAKVLRAERADQLRINRDEFTRSFKEAMNKAEPSLFRFPSDTEIDGKPVVEWCESHAHLQPGMKVARCDIQPTAAFDQASIVAQLLEQLGEHLPACTGPEAIERFRQHAEVNSDGIVTILIVGVNEDADMLAPIIESALKGPTPTVTRVVLLLAPAASGPDSIADATATVCTGGPFAKSDVILHLQKRWGLDSTESEQTYSSMESIGIVSNPARIYEYVKQHCGLAASRIT
ncbi:MAG: hypothetical protein HGA87_02420 [Desulfobulbaceae bacterium]|nr:hypothetical protein [Desulfobulbaceae bacterium]